MDTIERLQMQLARLQEQLTELRGQRPRHALTRRLEHHTRSMHSIVTSIIASMHEEKEQSAPVAAVFNTFELLEQILLNLSVEGLIYRAPYVDGAWQNAIRESISIQNKTFLTPDHEPSLEPVRILIVSYRGRKVPIYGFRIRVSDMLPFRERQYKCLGILEADSETYQFLHTHTPLLQRYVTQPPFKQLRIRVGIQPALRRKEEIGFACDVEASEGVRYQDVIDEVDRTLREHNVPDRVGWCVLVDLEWGMFGKNKLEVLQARLEDMQQSLTHLTR